MGTLLTAQFFCKPKSFLKNGAILTFFFKKKSEVNCFTELTPEKVDLVF